MTYIQMTFYCGTADESCNPTPPVSSVPWQQLEWLLCNNLFWTGVFLVPLSCRIFVVVEFSDIAKKINFYFRHFWFPLFLFIFLYNVRSIVVENTWVSTHFNFVNLCFQFFSNLKNQISPLMLIGHFSLQTPQHQRSLVFSSALIGSM